MGGGGEEVEEEEEEEWNCKRAKRIEEKDTWKVVFLYLLFLRGGGFMWTNYCALYQKSNLCIPGKENARPQSQFLHSCVCLWAIYIFPGSVHIFGWSKIDRPILEIYKSLKDIWV